MLDNKINAENNALENTTTLPDTEEEDRHDAIADAAVSAFKIAFNEREYHALRIQRFIFKFWIHKQAVKRSQICMVYKFLASCVFRMRANAQVSKRRVLARSKSIIYRAVGSYVAHRILKKKSAVTIRKNIRILFRNYQFREISSACRIGAQRLIQREWALRHSDLELRVSRVETYLNSSQLLPYEIRKRTTSPSPKHEVFVSADSWESISEFSKEELLECNLHVLQLRWIAEEPTVSLLDAEQALDAIEYSCAMNDVESGANLRMMSVPVPSLPQDGHEPPSHQKERRLSTKNVSKMRKVTAPLENPNRSNSDTDSHSRRGSKHMIQPKRPGRRHSKLPASGKEEAVVVGVKDHSDELSKFKEYSLLSQIDIIKNSLKL
jgi:hypothetical protein